MFGVCELIEIECGQLLLPYYSTVDAAALRGVCRRFRGAVTAYPWDDQDTCVYDLHSWARVFPRARHCKIAPSYAVLSRDLSPLRGMRNLRRVDIVGNNSASFGDWGVHELKGIQHLDLRMCDQISLSDLGLLALQGIKTLYFTARDVTDAGIGHLKGIQNLIVDGSVEITDAGLAGLAPYLRQLTMGPFPHLALTDAPFVALGQGLVELNLYELSHAALTDRTLQALTGLTSIGIHACNGAAFTNAGVRALAGVKHIALSEMDGVTCDDSAIAALAGVERLSLNSCRGVSITDVGIAAIAGVRTLSLTDCSGLQISDKGFLALAGVSALDLSWNRGARIQMSSIGVQALRGIHMLDMTDTGLYFTAEEMAPLTVGGTYINIDLPDIEWLANDQAHEDFDGSDNDSDNSDFDAVYDDFTGFAGFTVADDGADDGGAIDVDFENIDE
jgi:hypothetical protein